MNKEDDATNLIHIAPQSTDDISYELGSIYLHRWIDAQDEYNKWYEAQIIEIHPSSPQMIKVHYKGWKSKFDTWIDLESDPERARKLHTFTHRPPSKGTLDDFSLNTKCDCLDSTDKWYEAEIVAVNDNGELVSIHYKGWDNKYNEWINKDSYRLAPLHTMTKPQTNSQPTTTATTKPAAKTSPAPKVQTSTTNGVKSSKNKSPKSNKYKIKRKQLKRVNSDTRSIVSADSFNSNHNVTILDENDTENELKDDDITKDEIENEENIASVSCNNNEVICA